MATTNNNKLCLDMDSTSLPAEWERCLDLQSGKMYWVNTMTREKTWEDPTTRSQSKCRDEHLELKLSNNTNNGNGNGNMSDIESEESEMEMAVTACSHCGMYVLVRRASPICPNCKHVPSIIPTKGYGFANSSSHRN